MRKRESESEESDENDPKKKPRVNVSDQEFKLDESYESENELIDPTYDTPFKKLCSNKEVLISLLNTFLQLNKNDLIIDVDFMSQEDQPELTGQKTIRLDVICTDKNKNTFIVEMQKHNEPAFIKRTVYYCTKFYSSNLRKGSKYASLKPVKLLVFLNFNIFKNTNEYINHYVFKNVVDNSILTNDVQISYVELKKFNKTDIITIEDEWMYLLTDYKKKGEIENPSKEVSIAFEILKSMSYEEIEDYNNELQKAIDIEGIISNEKKESEKIGEEKGIKIGEEKGIKIGEEKGIKIGEEIGINKIALNLINEEYDDEKIIKITGLTKEKIKELKNKK
jgi:predicted transposase/invertase (TIGR01784 family)